MAIILNVHEVRYGPDLDDDRGALLALLRAGRHRLLTTLITKPLPRFSIRSGTMTIQKVACDELLDQIKADM